MAAGVRNVHHQNALDHEVFLFIFVFLHISAWLINYFMQLVLKVESKWICHSCKDSPWTQTGIGRLRLLLGLGVGLCNVTLQHSRWTSLHVAGWTRLIAAIKFYANAIAFLLHFFISPLFIFAFLHFSLAFLSFTLFWVSLPLLRLLMSSIFTFRICICSWLAWDTHKADARFAWSI